eukprot:TRINITY_DN1097_c0_g1_i1.p1 TRINITY_DN1097_c0_g1~~TRINITY_DN1097_c0_g1_i1.p1  ORF type:complete len:236 (+),score=14.72 TRINITY_DN1097_c0_g1_i1:163-870(+)
MAPQLSYGLEEALHAPIDEISDVFSEDVDEMSYVFDLMDRDRDGRISAAELASVLASLGEDERRIDDTVRAMMSQADVDGDGYVDFEEFLRVSQSAYGGSCAPAAFCASSTSAPPVAGDRYLGEREGPTLDDLEAAFRLFDRNGDGYITADELREVMAGIWEDEDLTVDECLAMIGGVDIDGDGRLCFEEFVRMMGGSMPPQQQQQEKQQKQQQRGGKPHVQKRGVVTERTGLRC